MFAVEDGDIQTLAVASCRLFQIPESEGLTSVREMSQLRGLELKIPPFRHLAFTTDCCRDAKI